MRNLYISTYPASYRVDLCNVLAERLDCDIYHYVPVDNEAETLRGARFVNHRLPTGHLFGKVFPKGLEALVASSRPSVVFVQEFSFIALRLLQLRKRYSIRVVSICDDGLDMIQGHDFGRAHRLARRFVPRWLDSLIVSTDAVRGWYGARFGKGILMPIIADERRVRPELERVLPLSERLRPGEKPVVAFVGRLVGLKNIPTLIRAFEPLKDRAQLVIIGDGPLRDALEAMAPDALFTGQLSGDELLAWYNLIDILVLPSTQEAYGAVTGEALMAGAKVVVSRKAGSADLVREGENGFVVDPMDAAAITDRIGRLLDTVPSGRPVALRENLLPYRFESCIRNLLEEINAL